MVALEKHFRPVPQGIDFTFTALGHFFSQALWLAVQIVDSQQGSISAIGGLSVQWHAQMLLQPSMAGRLTLAVVEAEAETRLMLADSH